VDAIGLQEVFHCYAGSGCSLVGSEDVRAVEDSQLGAGEQRVGVG
jgi:hypothetical protein